MQTDPTSDTLLSLYHSGAWLCLVVVAAYLGLRWASKHWTWLAAPAHANYAHYVTAAIAGLAVLVVPAAQGTLPNLSMLLCALGAVATLALPGLPSRPSSPPPSQAGHVNLGLLGFVAVFGFVVGCAWLSKESKTSLGKDVINCLDAEQSKAIGAFAPVVDALLVEATGGDGQIDVQRLKAGTKSMTAEVGGCVLADAIARALAPKPADPNAPKSSPLEADRSLLRAAFEILRADQLAHKVFRTAYGVI